MRKPDWTAGAKPVHLAHAIPSVAARNAI